MNASVTRHVAARGRRQPGRSAQFSVEIVDPRTNPEPPGWSTFRRRALLQPVWDYGLLRLEAWLARNPPVLAVIRDGADVVGACVVMICSPWRGRAFAPRPSARRSRREAFTPRWAEVYLPLLSGYPACAFQRGVSVEGRRAAVRQFERALIRHAGAGLLGVVYRAMTEDLAPAMEGPGRVSREIDPTTVMDNSWSSVDEWVGSLRPDLRRTVQQLAADDSIDVATGAARADLDASELAALLNQHRATQDARAWNGGQRARVAGLHLDTRSPVPAPYLDAFVRRPDVITRTYRDSEGRLLAFNTMIDHPLSVAMHHWAARPVSHGGRRLLYADGYAHCVRRMIAAGRPELTAGRTLLETKAAFGFGTRALLSVAVPRPVMGR